MKILVVFHNLCNYDRHLIMTALGTSEVTTGEKIGYILKTQRKKYMTFNVDQLQFIDSLQFMNSSLERLSANLQKENPIITSRGVSGIELA